MTGMRKSRFTEEQIIGFLKQAKAGVPIKELCRSGGFSDATFYKWRAKYGGMDVPDATQVKDLESENARLNKLPLLRACILRLIGSLILPKQIRARRSCAATVAG